MQIYHLNWPSTIAIATTTTTTTPLPPPLPTTTITTTTTAIATTKATMTVTGTGTETTMVTTAQALPLQTQPILDSALFSDLLELTIDEKKTKKKAILTKTVSESAAVTCAASSGRLPVFVQLSNPSPASWNKWFELLSDD
ncbi:unnamed protein product [Wuchereria bancrofti]|uniref:Uncharacterized protein n=1 Tax=Wuchereria bancrofti TaxID=6293 RepID=A0A3P7G247_WUCBA|nr:unnamed protein product [Wuchereria bancrofti]